MVFFVNKKGEGCYVALPLLRMNSETMFAFDTVD